MKAHLLFRLFLLALSLVVVVSCTSLRGSGEEEEEDEDADDDDVGDDDGDDDDSSGDDDDDDDDDDAGDDDDSADDDDAGDDDDDSEPDLSCVEFDLLQGAARSPANISLFFQLLTCGGDPVPRLESEDFQLLEDDDKLSSLESQFTIANTEEAFAFDLMLVLDMSGSMVDSGDADILLDAAETFVQDESTGKEVAIAIFDGRPNIQLIVDFTPHESLLLAAIDSLRDYVVVDSSTNLYGAVIDGLDALDDRAAEAGLHAASLVVFTDGSDHAGYYDFTEALAAVELSPHTVFTIGLGSEYDVDVLTQLGRDGFVEAAAATELSDAFEAINGNVTDLAASFYAVMYCTPARANLHDLTLEVIPNNPDGILSYSFDATGFTGGCDPTDDVDGDGFSVEDGDCNDYAADSTTTSTDADCDGILTGLDCDDADDTSNAVSDDGDCDGAPTLLDCNDSNPSIGTSLDDFDCDGVPTADDCDDADDELGAESLDADCDGHETIPDCDDEDPAVGSIPGDGDCDGVVSALDCVDSDPASTIVATDADCDGVLTADDCDDSLSTVGAFADDADCDGSPTAEDCDDSNAGISPMAGDSYGNGLDGDCDGLHCEAGSNGATYFAVCPMAMTWSDAEATCQSAGYDGLASILYISDQDYIVSLAAAITGWHFWIGYNDISVEASWVWQSGLGTPYAAWAPDEPTSDGDCAWLAGADYSPWAGDWFPGLCTASVMGAYDVGFVCEGR